MVNIHQRSFAGGLIDSALSGRIDRPQRAQGVKALNNWYVTRLGSIQNRGGLRYCGTFKDSHDDIRLWAYKIDESTAYLLEVGEKYIRFWNAGAVKAITGGYTSWADLTPYEPGDIVEETVGGTFHYCVATHTSASGTNGPATAGTEDDFWYALTASGSDAILEVPTPYAQADLSGLDIKQSGSEVVFTSRNHPQHILKRNGDLDWSMLPMEVKATIAAPVVQVGSPNGDTAGSQDIRYRVSAIKSGTFEESLPCSDGDTTYTGKAVADPEVTSGDLQVTHLSHPFDNGDEIHITGVDAASGEANENAVLALKDKIFVVSGSTTHAFLLRDTDGLLTRPSIATSWPDITIDYALAWYPRLSHSFPKPTQHKIQLTWAEIDDAQEYWVYRSVDSGPFGFIGSTRTLDFLDEGQIADEEFTPKIFRNPFVDGAWPSAVGEHQQRRFFASTDDDPRRVYGSVTGDADDYSVRSPIEDADALEFAIADERADEVRHLTNLGQLIVMTNGSIWTAAGDGAGTITPTLINLQTLSTEGAAASPAPLRIGDGILYVESLGSIVRELRFDIQEGGFAGYSPSDVTVFAKSIFDGYTISNWDYARVPNSIGWMCRNDGTLLGVSHLRDQEILAWSTHTTAASGEFKDVAVIPEDGVDTPYFFVKRTIDGAVVRNMERLSPRKVGQYQQDQHLASVFLDSSLTYDGTHSAATTTMELTGGSTWASGETGLTLTAGAATFPGDASNVGEGYRLQSATDSSVYVEVQVTGDASTTVQTVTLLTACPAALQSTSTTSWVAMVRDFPTSLSHLEGESVTVLADSNVLGPYTVTSGAISQLSRPYGIMHIGLLIPETDVRLFDVDSADQGGSALYDRMKQVQAVTLDVRNTRGIQAGPDASYLADLAVDGDDTTTGLLTGLRRCRIKSRPSLTGAELLIRQSLPLPAEIYGVVREVHFGEAP